MLCSFSNLLLFGASIFSAIAAPTPEAPIAKRQSKIVLSTIAPNYLVPFVQSDPDHAYGSQYTGDVSWTPDEANEWTTVVGFDIPTVEGANSCYLRFVLPPIAQTNFSWDVEGSGIMDIYSLDRPVNPSTDTWNSRPIRVDNVGSATAQGGPPGGEALMGGAEFDCHELFTAKRVDWEFVPRVGPVKNRVETFQRTPADGQGWFLEFANVA